MSRRGCGLDAVEFYRILFAVAIGVGVTAVVAWTVYLEFG